MLTFQTHAPLWVAVRGMFITFAWHTGCVCPAIGGLSCVASRTLFTELSCVLRGTLTFLHISGVLFSIKDSCSITVVELYVSESGFLPSFCCPFRADVNGCQTAQNCHHFITGWWAACGVSNSPLTLNKLNLQDLQCNNTTSASNSILLQLVKSDFSMAL